MPVPDFLNQTSIQPYPLIAGNHALGALTIDPGYLLDVGLVFGPASDFEHEDPVYLTSVVADATNVTFTFSAGTTDVLFIVPRVTAVGGVIYSDDTPTVGFGFLQVGDLSGIANGTYTGEAEVEPGRAQTLFQKQVTSLNVANKYTTLYWDSDCEAAPVVDHTHRVAAEDLTGDVELAPGRFAVLSQLDVRNQILVSAARTAVEGGESPCPDDLSVKPVGWTDAEPECSEMLSTINGVAPNPDTGSFVLYGSRGVAITRVSAHALQVLINQSVLFKRTREDVTCSSDSSVA